MAPMGSSETGHKEIFLQIKLRHRQVPSAWSPACIQAPVTGQLRVRGVSLSTGLTQVASVLAARAAWWTEPMVVATAALQWRECSVVAVATAGWMRLLYDRHHISKGAGRPRTAIGVGFVCSRQQLLSAIVKTDLIRLLHFTRSTVHIYIYIYIHVYMCATTETKGALTMTACVFHGKDHSFLQVHSRTAAII